MKKPRLKRAMGIKCLYFYQLSFKDCSHYFTTQEETMNNWHQRIKHQPMRWVTIFRSRKSELDGRHCEGLLSCGIFHFLKLIIFISLIVCFYLYNSRSELQNNSYIILTCITVVTLVLLGSYVSHFCLPMYVDKTKLSSSIVWSHVAWYLYFSLLCQDCIGYSGSSWFL